MNAQEETSSAEVSRETLHDCPSPVPPAVPIGLSSWARFAALRAETGAALAAGGPTEAVLRTCADALVRHLDGACARVWVLDDAEQFLDLRVSVGAGPCPKDPFSRVPVGSLRIGWVARWRRPHLSNEVAGDPYVADPGWASREGLASFAGLPLAADGRAVGVLALFARQPLLPETLDGLAAVADALGQFVARRRAQEALARREDQVLRAQRLEVVGRLTSGVAHELGNLLTPIDCYSGLLLTRLEDSTARGWVKEIRWAGEQAASLVHRLQGLSRSRVAAPITVDLNAAVGELAGLIRGLVGANVELALVPGEGLWPVRLDPERLSLALLNLAANARDTMPAGGRLTIETSNVQLDEEQAESLSSVRPGRYVRLAVTDTGCGMDAGTRARLFEPFFTTKGERGTGLGLASVAEFVRECGGYTEVQSEVGAGSSFRLFLPRAG
jgi:signal transduction histidine kinase